MNVQLAKRMKDGMVKNVLVLLDSSKLVEFAKHVMPTVIIMATTVFVI